MVTGIITILGGILAASGFIISRKPNAKELIDKITPYQGWIGIFLFAWGVFGVIGTLSILGWISSNFVAFLITALIPLSNLFVGFLLGFGLLSKYLLSKNEKALQKGQEIRTKLMKFQVPLGFLSISTGLLFVFWSLKLYMVGYIAAPAFFVSYVILALVMGKPKGSLEESAEVAVETGETTTPAVKEAAAKPTTDKKESWYQNRVVNASIEETGKKFKVTVTFNTKKFEKEASGKEQEVTINDAIEVGAVSGDKEIYLKSHRFTKKVSTLVIELDQRPDKIGIDPHNKLQEK